MARSEDASSGAQAPGAEARCWSLVVALLPGLLLAVWLYWPSRAVGWISDDTAALGYVQRAGALADVDGPQYGLHAIRFWRPLVSASLGAVAEVFGPRAEPQRVFNLLAHLASIALGGLLACSWASAGAARHTKRRLAALAAACSAALLLASFPFQGGTVTWIVGRVDGLALPFLLLAGLAGARAGGRSALPLAVVATAGAVATKEIGFAAPLAVLGGALAAGRPRWLGASLASAATLGVLLALRALALGTLVGGYAFGGALDFGRWATALGELAAVLWPVATLGLLLLGLSALGRLGWVRVAIGAGLPICGALVLLSPLLLGGGLLPEHRRWMLVPDAFLCLLAAAALGRLVGGRNRGLAAIGFGLMAVGCVQRGRAAAEHTAAWCAAGNAAGAFELAVRNAAAGLAPDRAPVLVAEVPRISADGLAYVLHYGFAERFAEPFEPTPRPVWPWRSVYGDPRSDRGPVVMPLGGLRFPNIDPLPVGAVRSVPPIELRMDGELLVPRRTVLLTPELLEGGGGPALELIGSPSAPRLELVLYTPLGYEPAAWGGVWPPPDGRLELPLRELLLSPGVVPLAETLALAADLGARAVYLELRAVDDERGQTSRPIAASAWIRLELSEAFARGLLERVWGD